MHPPRASGSITEHLVVVELLRRGHKVAVPVVDDDGVDLVVNYRDRVQVKGATVTQAPNTPGYSYARLRWASASRGWTGADFYVFHGGGRWFVVPQAALWGWGRTINFYLDLEPRGEKANTLVQYEDAWHIFDGESKAP